MVLEKTLESPLDCKEIQPINPKGNQSEYSLERLVLKLKLQYFGHLMWRAVSLEKTLMLGKIEGRRRKGRQRMRWLDGITNSWTWVWVSSGSWWWTGKPGVLQSMGSQGVGHNWVTELNWTDSWSLLATLKYVGCEGCHGLYPEPSGFSTYLWLFTAQERCQVLEERTHCWIIPGFLITAFLCLPCKN